ncbi:MAG: hypothetical protein AAGG02_16820 [Cyanobacteria bacterium P01_H01_bin.15]
MSLCAERNAITTAVAAEGPELRIVAIAVVGNPGGSCSPYEACRQVLLEFGPEATVLYAGQSGWVLARSQDLLPAAFVFTPE